MARHFKEYFLRMRVRFASICKSKAGNYARNQALAAPISAVPETAGFLNEQHKMADFRYGRFYSDANGCSWMSVYNALHILHGHSEPADIIRSLESRPVFCGLILGGALGAYPWAVSGYFKRLGYRVGYAFRVKSALRRTVGADACIALYLRKNGTAHYVAFANTGGVDDRGRSVFLFLNYHDHGAPGFCKMALEDFLVETNSVLHAVISLSQKATPAGEPMDNAPL